MHDRTRIRVAFALTVVAMLVAMGVVTATLEGSPSAQPARPTYPFEALLDAGLKDDTRIDAGELGRLVTAGLVHTTRTHFVVNAVALVLVSLFWWQVNVTLRRVRHAWLLPAIALISSSGGFFVSYLMRAGPSGGASAGVYGILAAVAGASWAVRGELPKSVRLVAPIALTLLSLGAVAIMLGKAGMDHAAHFGGWGVGFVAGIAAHSRVGRVVLGTLAAGLIVLAIAT